VVYWNNQPTPYLTARLNAVVDAAEVDIRAWFDVQREGDRNWEVRPADWKFPATVLPKSRVGGIVMPFPSYEMLTNIDVLVCPIDRFHGAMAAVAGRAIAGRVVSRTLPVFETWVEKRFRSEMAYKFLYRAIDGAKVSGDDAAEMAKRYGLPRSRIWNVTQAIDLDLYSRATQFSAGETAELKRILGLRGCTYIYVGRLWEGKGVKFLIDAFLDLMRQGFEASLIIIGDGSDEAALRAQALDQSNIHFVGFIQPEELPPWYAIADVFVFPTLGDPNGLVVEEAMAAGLPVVSTANAGDIRARVLDGETGFVVRAFDSRALAEKMAILANDEALRVQMSRRSILAAQRFSVKNYADDFNRFIEGVLALAPRSGVCAHIAHVTGRAMTALARESRSPSLRESLMGRRV
jgi:glycosyltransferase involved in cell wall biosynthesis